MKFETVWEKVGALPYTNQDRCRRLYDMIIENNLGCVLELGFAYGKMACVAAAAVEEVTGLRGPVFAVDLEAGIKWQNPPIEQTVSALGLEDWVRVFRERVSYQWWLIQYIDYRARLGLPYPTFDLIILDGAHNVYHDVGAFFLAERLLNPGGFLIVDDLPWVPAKGMTAPIIWDIDIRGWSEAEQNTAHMQLIWDLLVKTHPAFDEFDDSDVWWGVARKRRG